MQDNYLFSEEISHTNHFSFLNYILPWADKRSKEADPDLHVLAVRILQTLMNKTADFIIQQVELEPIEKGLSVIVNHRVVLLVPSESAELPDPPAVTRMVKYAKKRHQNKRLILTFLHTHPFESRLNNLKTQLVHHLKMYRNTTPDHKQHQLVLEYYENMKNNLSESLKRNRHMEA